MERGEVDRSSGKEEGKSGDEHGESEDGESDDEGEKSGDADLDAAWVASTTTLPSRQRFSK